MFTSRRVGQEFFPDRGRSFPIADVPQPLLHTLRRYRVRCRSSRTFDIDLLEALERIAALQLRHRPPARSPRAGPYDRKVVAYSVAGLSEARTAVIDFLMNTFGAAPFLPVTRKNGELWITLGWFRPGAFWNWFTAVDSNHRDISGWNRRRITNRHGTRIVVTAAEFYRLTHDRAHTVRVWLPALEVPVLFTRVPAVPPAIRSRSPRCFSLQTLWGAFDVA